MDIIDQIIRAKTCSDLLARQEQLQAQLDDVTSQLDGLNLTDKEQQASVQLYSDIKTAVSMPSIQSLPPIRVR